MTSVLVVDNYDSFTYNLAHLFGELPVTQGPCGKILPPSREL